MSHYADITINDNGNITHTPVTNEWVLNNKSNTYSLTSNKTQITGNGIDTALVKVQLKTPYLIDGSRNNIAQITNFTLVITNNGTNERYSLSTDANGYYETTVFSSLVGSVFTIYIEEYDLEVLNIGVI